MCTVSASETDCKRSMTFWLNNPPHRLRAAAVQSMAFDSWSDQLEGTNTMVEAAYRRRLVCASPVNISSFVL
jgi:hypothetical protein